MTESAGEVTGDMGERHRCTDCLVIPASQHVVLINEALLVELACPKCWQGRNEEPFESRQGTSN